MIEYQAISDTPWKDRDQQREATLDAPAVKVREKAQEKALWDHYIQPVVDGHFKGKYQYRYFEEPAIITNRDIDSMLRTTMGLCMDGYDLIFPTDCFEKEVLRRLRDGNTEYTQNKEYGPVDLKELFGDFLWWLFDDKTLPIYLSFLDLEYGPEGLWEVASSDSDQKNKKDYISKSATVSDSHLGKDISSEQALNDAVSIVSEDIIRLYNGMKELLKAKGLTLSKADESQQKEACQKFYDKNSDKFTSLKLNHVEAAIDNSNYWGTNNSARDIKGGLFQQFISHKHSYLFADKNLKTNSQDLYSLFTKLQKQS
jgi:hypothetical protein